MKIEIDYNDMIKEVTTIMAERVVREYLDAYDIQDYQKREVESAVRSKRILDAIDWSNAPDSLSASACKVFFERIVNKF